MAKKSAQFCTIYCTSQYSNIILCICHRGVKYIDLTTQEYMDDVPYIYGKFDVPYSIITFYKYLNNIVYYRAYTSTSKFILYNIE